MVRLEMATGLKDPGAANCRRRDSLKPETKKAPALTSPMLRWRGRA